MKKICMLLVAVLLIALLPGALAEEEKTLNIFTWAGYFDETTLAQFQDETGIKVNYSVFASNEEMLLKMQAGEVSDYDLILASDYAISTLRKDGGLLPLDKSLLTNWDNLNPDYLNQYFDPENVYSMPYTVGVPVIVYDPAQVEGELASFADLWDPQFEDSLWLIDDARQPGDAAVFDSSYGYYLIVFSERYLDASDKLTNNAEGIAGWNGYYDANGDLIINSRYDQDRNPVD